MYIKSIKWIEKEIKEAIVILSNDKTDLICFSQPFEKTLFEKIDIIYCLSVENVCISEKNEYSIKYNQMYNTYTICGKLKDKKIGIVLFEDIKIDISNGYIPNDINENDYICFTTNRLDIY